MRDVINLDLESRSAEDIKTAGAHRYSHHPSTEIVSLAWSLNDSVPVLWRPGDPVPPELADAIRRGARVEAWNAQFERVMWRHFELFGFPPIDLRQWYCTMVRAYLMGYPGKLDKAGPSMGLGVVKDEAGHRVMLQVAKPRKTFRPADPGYADALDQVHTRDWLPEYTSYHDRDTDELVVCQWWVDDGRLTRVYDYNLDDVRTELAASRFLDDIPPIEHAAWCLDQQINDRGFYLDMVLVERARAVVRPATTRANEALATLTDGELRSVTKPNDIRAWLNEKLGLKLDSIDKDTLTDLLHQVEHDELPADPVVVDVIKLRLAAAKTSTAKLNAMIRGICEDGRIHGGLQFAGAGRTNRWSGRIVQPHNFPRPPKWAVQAVEEVLAGHRLEVLDLLYDEPLEVISAILRSCITAEPGNELHVADYNAIESRITAWISGADRLLNAYHTGKDPYRMQAATVYGIEAWESIDKDSFERQLGKKIILGCFTADTEVLTKRGWVPIINLSATDSVWDGESWVQHDGVIYQGRKPVIEYAGVKATPDHRVLTPEGWEPIHQVRNASMSRQRQVHALVDLPFAALTWAPVAGSKRSSLPATAPRMNTGWTSIACSGGPARNAIPAPNRPAIGGKRNCTDTPPSCPTSRTGSVGSTAGMRYMADATGHGVKAIRTMVPEGSILPKSGMISANSCGTYRRFLGGTTQCLSWIAETTTARTHRIMSGWSLIRKTWPICGAASAYSTPAGSGALLSSPESSARSSAKAPFIAGSRRERAQNSASETSALVGQNVEPVYDILNAGPRSRFTIRTANGPLIVHNCGFGMGKDRFWSSCREDGLYIDKALASRAVEVYREDNYQIKDAWYDLDRAAKRAVNGEAVPALDGKVWFYRDEKFLRCRLPSGRVLSYANPFLKDSTTPWGSPSSELMFWGWNGQKGKMEWQKMYGGRWMENIVQATARDVLRDAMLRLHADGWHIILTVHDEVLNEEPKGSRTLAEMITIMEQPPRWATDLPLKVEGWTGIRYRK